MGALRIGRIILHRESSQIFKDLSSTLTTKCQAIRPLSTPARYRFPNSHTVLTEGHKHHQKEDKKENKTFITSIVAGSLFVYCASTKMESDKEISQKADILYNNNDFAGLYEYLADYSDSNDANVVWRLARASKEYAELPVKTADDKKKLHFAALGYAKRSLELDDKNFACHKWYGIMLSVTGDYEGTKKKLQNAFTIQECFLKALELNPTDATSSHLLGLWYFTFAELPWYQKKIAAALFATPPEATYEQALDCFLKAEKVDPDFYSTNHLMLGKTYMRLNNKSEAKKWFEKTKSTNKSTTEAIKNRQEAEELLRNL